MYKVKAYCWIVSFIFIASFNISGQDQKVADSLAVIYYQGTSNDTEKLELLRNLAFNELKSVRIFGHPVPLEQTMSLQEPIFW